MGTNLQIIELSLPLGSLDAYIQRVNQIPMISVDAERDFATRLQTDNDLNAARQLILPHLRFVVRIARGYMGYGLLLADLIQEGNIGLMKAVKRFNPEVGVRLISFAVHWIKAEIHEFIIRNWRIVKVATTKAQRKLFFNLRSSKKRLGWFSQDEVKAVAADLGVSPEVVREMESRMAANDAAFDGGTDDDSDQPLELAPSQYLEDHRYDPASQLEANDWSEQGHNKLHTALTKLDERSQEILAQRWLQDKKVTLQELADKYQVSAERIRQLENNAMKRLKEAMLG